MLDTANLMENVRFPDTRITNQHNLGRKVRKHNKT